MRRRTTLPEPQLEITPLIDVVFLLLTFFVFAMVLATRVQITGVRLPEGGEGEAAEQATFVVVALKRDGALAVDDTEVQWAGLGEAIAERVSAAPEAEVVVAPDADSRSEDLFRLMDALARSGWRDIRFLRQPGEGPDAGAPE
jgi:biopolymer transport protein ExbD